MDEFGIRKSEKYIYLRTRTELAKHKNRVFGAAGCRMVPGIFSTEGTERVYLNSL